MREHGYAEGILINKEPSVEQAVECVRRGILTEMDARDLARCIATEQCGDGLKVYTVSKEVGGVYREDRHIYANFNNSRGFCNKLIESFGQDVQFQQVILDYYWMPTVSYCVCAFFNNFVILWGCCLLYGETLGNKLDRTCPSILLDVLSLYSVLTGVVGNSMGEITVSKHTP